MSQLAARVPSNSAFASVPAPVDVDGAIARYVDTAFEQLRRALVDSAPALSEPSTSDFDRARERANLLVETLEGFAIGSVVGRVAAAARRAMPDAGDAIVRALSGTRVSPAPENWGRAPVSGCAVSGSDDKLLLER